MDSGRAASEYNYVRIKILTEEGANQCEREIPFEKADNVVSIKARRSDRTDRRSIMMEKSLKTRSLSRRP